MTKKLDKIFKNSKKVPIDNNSKIVIMSDCHRGIGDNLDNFIKNKTIYEAALMHYYHNGFTYIELGDGDEMWEVKNYKDIININLDIFKQLKKFHENKRLIMLYGNHDISKKYSKTLDENFYKYYDKISNNYKPLLDGLTIYESLILTYQNYDIFLIHGHQVDFLNNELWFISRFLVQYIWKYLEYFGLKDPTSAAKNYKVASKVEKKLKDWSIKNNKIIIAGHTHRSIFPKVGQSLYFNDGSCIHSNGITCIEIENGNITLVQWELKPNKDKFILATRNILAESIPIIKFYNKKYLKS